MIRNQSLSGTFCSHNQVPVLFWDNRTLIIYKLFSHKIHNIFFIWRQSRLPFLLLRYIEIAIIKLLYSCWRKIQYDMMYDLNPNAIYPMLQTCTDDDPTLSPCLLRLPLLSCLLFFLSFPFGYFLSFFILFILFFFISLLFSLIDLDSALWLRRPPVGPSVVPLTTTYPLLTDRNRKLRRIAVYRRQAERVHDVENVDEISLKCVTKTIS